METERRNLSAEATQNLEEGISLIFFHWTALQLAINHQSAGAGVYSGRIVHEFMYYNVFLQFTQSKEPVNESELEDKLEIFCRNYLDAEFEDGSIEQVTKDLIQLHAESWENDFTFVERLRKKPRVPLNFYVKLAMDGEAAAAAADDRMEGDDDEGVEGDDGSSNLMVDAGNPEPGAQQMNMSVDKPSPKKETGGDEDGWITVSSKKKKKNWSKQK